MNLAPMPPFKRELDMIWAAWAYEAIPLYHKFKPIDTTFEQDYMAVRLASEAGDSEAIAFRNSFHNFLVARRLKGHLVEGWKL